MASPALLQVTTVPQTHFFLLPYARHFRAKSWRVDGVAAGIEECEPCQEAYDGVFDMVWSRNPFDPRNLIRAAPRMRRIVEGGGYDLVHVHTPVAAFVTRYALRTLRRTQPLQVIYTAHGFHFHRHGHPLKNRAFIMLEKLAGRWTDYLIVINREDEEDARKYGILPPDRIRYMPGIGLDLSYYHPKNISRGALEALRKELQLEEGQFLLTMVAEFEPRKRHRDALDALALLGDDRVVLAFAGTGSLEASMKRRAEVLGLSHQVRFLGFRSDVPRLMAASLATILPSEREGLSRAVMESMALGTPVIASEAKGNSDLLADGVGILVPIGDPQALARAIHRLLTDPAEAQRMGARAREHIRAYDLQHIIQLHESLYKEALANLRRNHDRLDR